MSENNLKRKRDEKEGEDGKDVKERERVEGEPELKRGKFVPSRHISLDEAMWLMDTQKREERVACILLNKAYDEYDERVERSKNRKIERAKKLNELFSTQRIKPLEKHCCFCLKSGEKIKRCSFIGCENYFHKETCGEGTKKCPKHSCQFCREIGKQTDSVAICGDCKIIGKCQEHFNLSCPCIKKE
jgi:hypothetical protein